MRLEKITGFIIYTFPLGEADLLVTCFSSGGNIVKFIAKGSRKVKSRFAASVQLFNLGQYVIYHGAGLPILRQADIVDSFMAIRRDWAKSGAALFVLDIVRWLIADSAREAEVFQLVFAYFLHLKENQYTPLAFNAFCLQLAAAAGWEMSFRSCAVCGEQSKADALLVWGAGGAVCPRCSREKGLTVNRSQLALLDSLLDSTFAQADQIAVSPRDRDVCAAATDSLIIWLTEGKTKAQAFRKLYEGFRTAP